MQAHHKSFGRTRKGYIFNGLGDIMKFGTGIITNSKTRKEVDTFLNKVFKRMGKEQGFQVDEIYTDDFVVTRKENAD